jgi:hypothetical protein
MASGGYCVPPLYTQVKTVATPTTSSTTSSTVAPTVAPTMAPISCVPGTQPDGSGNCMVCTGNTFSSNGTACQDCPSDQIHDSGHTRCFTFKQRKLHWNSNIVSFCFHHSMSFIDSSLESNHHFRPVGSSLIVRNTERVRSEIRHDLPERRILSFRSARTHGGHTLRCRNRTSSHQRDRKVSGSRSCLRHSILHIRL